MYINSAKDSKMRIINELVLEPNTYGLGCPYLATYDGFISLNHPVKMTDEYGI